MKKELIIFKPNKNSQEVEWTSPYTRNAKEIGRFLARELKHRGSYHLVEEILKNPSFRMEDREGNDILDKIKDDIIQSIDSCEATKDVGRINILSENDVIRCLTAYLSSNF